MKVLLLHLPLPRSTYVSRFSVPEPLAALYLGPALAPRHEVRFVDLRITPDLARELDGFAPDAIACGVGLTSFGTAGPVLGELKRRFPNARALLFADAEYGNSHVHERPLDFACDAADAIVHPFFLAPLRRVVAQALEAWEGARDLAEVAGLLVRHGDGWRATAAVENRVADVGVPDRTLLGRARGSYRFAGIGRMAHVFGTYGCRHKCRFCPMSKHDGSMSARSLDDVTAELLQLTEPNVFLQDYEPFLAPATMHELADRVEREGIRKRWYVMTRADTALEQRELIARWRRLGLRWLYLGVDAATPERLKELRKGTTPEVNQRAVREMRRLGLFVTVGFVVRPDATLEDLRATYAYGARLGASQFGFSLETPLVGTRLMDLAESRLTTRDWSLFDLTHAVLPTSMPLDELYRELARLQTLAAARGLLSMYRHWPLRDSLRASFVGWAAVRALGRAARDHGAGPGTTEWRAPTVASAT
jgi:hopanoid C-3 methylase